MSDTGTEERVNWYANLEERMGTWIGITRETSFMPLCQLKEKTSGWGPVGGLRDPEIRGVMRDALTGLAEVLVPSEIVIRWIIESEKKAKEILAMVDRTNTK